MLPASKPGGSLHDFGDGLYFTNSKEVAEQYASTRVMAGGGSPQLFHIILPRGHLGRVLDLTADSRWEKFIMQPYGRDPNQTLLSVIVNPRKGANSTRNEMYSRFFQIFAEQHKIDLRKIDAVIGPEYVRGGLQMGILHKDGAPSKLAQDVRMSLRPLGEAPQMPIRLQQTVSGGTGPQTRTQPDRTGNLGYDGGALGSALYQVGTQRAGMIGNQAAVAMLGGALAGLFTSVNDRAIRRNVEAQLSGHHAAAMDSIMRRGDGVLVIIRLEQWAMPDFNGSRMRRLHSVSLQGGKSQQSALNQWQSMPRMFAGPPKGWLAFEEYVWISPQF